MDESKNLHIVMIAITAIVAIVGLIALVLMMRPEQSNAAGDTFSIADCINLDHTCTEGCYDVNAHPITCPQDAVDSCHQAAQQCYKHFQGKVVSAQ